MISVSRVSKSYGSGPTAVRALDDVSEGSDSAYYNVLAVKAEMKDDPRVQKLYKILTSQDMKDFLQTKYKGLVIPAS
jgi:ABC-type metal ion transport system substrate-binding protein